MSMRVSGLLPDVLPNYGPKPSLQVARSLPEAREKRLKRKEEEEKVGKQFDLAVEELKEEGLSLEDAHSEGLGDTIEKVLSKFGITTKLVENLAGITKCRCKERKKWLNKIFPYRKKEKE